MSGICPHCGYSLTSDSPLVGKRWSIALHEVAFDGQSVPLTPGERLALYTIAKSHPKPASATLIGERISVDAEDLPGLARVIIRRLRIKLPSIPFSTSWGEGYRWTGEILEILQ